MGFSNSLAAASEDRRVNIPAQRIRIYRVESYFGGGPVGTDRVLSQRPLSSGTLKSGRTRNSIAQEAQEHRSLSPAPWCLGEGTGESCRRRGEFGLLNIFFFFFTAGHQIQRRFDDFIAFPFLGNVFISNNIRSKIKVLINFLSNCQLKHFTFCWKQLGSEEFS